ncbi:MAG: M20/M25/M40 family metallo-hydrolase, partial [Armatimonadetes bacterium]|nr:M20/M25/M40 family metallo-hydrolase [Armatimonadota bacterium]
PIPSVGIANEDGQRLRRALGDGMRPSVSIKMANSVGDGVAHNVIAEITGTGSSDEVVFAGAHLDSWDVGQGATDNGLGCAIVLEAARALRSRPGRPTRTIRFALWAAEETGLHGSRAYVANHAAELDRIVGVMNFDMTGDPHGYWMPGNEDAPGFLRDLARRLAPLGMREEFGHKPGLHSDHQPFMLAGVPVLALTGRLPDGGGGHYYHTAGDTFEKVSLPGLCRAAAVAAHTLWALAEAPERPYRRKSREEVDAMMAAAGLADAMLD